jgi:hypothetical protein
MGKQLSSARHIQNLTRVCSVDGCGKIMRFKGYCTEHLAAWRKLDDAAKAAALAGMPMPRKPYEYLGDEESLIRMAEQTEKGNDRDRT